MMAQNFGKLRSPQVREAVEANSLVLLPVGQTEEHGAHLPLVTDALIARLLTVEKPRMTIACRTLLTLFGRP